MKTSKAKKNRKRVNETSEFFLQLGLGSYQDRSRFFPSSGNDKQEKSVIYIPGLSGNSQPFCINEY
jgi:hypothetical protein